MSRKKKILQRLKQLQLTQRQLAKHAMLSVDALNLWIDAKIVIPYTSILRISDLLDLEPEDIVEIV